MTLASNRKVLENHALTTSISLFMPSQYVGPLHPAAATNNSSSTARHNNHLKPITPNFDSSIALTILILVTAIFFMGFFSVYLRCFAKEVTASSTEQVAAFRRRRNQQRQQLTSFPGGGESSAFNQHGLDPTIVGSLPLVLAYIVNCGKADSQPFECVVCLNEFQDREMVKMIPYCEHVFHPECIDTWFLSHSSCPLCRSTKLFPSPNCNSNGNSVLLPVMNNKADASSTVLPSLTSESDNDHVMTLDDDDDGGGGHVGLVTESLETSTVVVEGDNTGGGVAKLLVVEREVGLIIRTRSCSSLSVNGNKRSSTIDQVLLLHHHDHQLQRSSSSRF